MRSSNEDVVTVLIIALTCFFGGLAVGGGVSSDSWEELVVKRGYAHYDGVTRKFTWNDTEKTEAK